MGDFATAALSILPGLVECDDVCFIVIDCTTDPARLRCQPASWFPPLSPREMAAVLRSHPAATAFAGGAAPWPVRVSDLVDFSEFARTRAYRVLLAPRAVHHQVVLPLFAATHGRIGEAYAFNRRGQDFAHRDLVLAAAMQPVLTALHLARDVDAERCDLIGPAVGHGTVSDHGLTRREHEILVYLATGMTAAAVGRALSISARTVGKHAENAYAKLRVHNRQEAINMCRRLGMMDSVLSRATL